MVIDIGVSFKESFMDLFGYYMVKEVVNRCYRDIGFSFFDVDVLEVYDCFFCNEFFMYEVLQLVLEGRGADFIRNGKWVINKNGG